MGKRIHYAVVLVDENVDSPKITFTVAGKGYWSKKLCNNVDLADKEETKKKIFEDMSRMIDYLYDN